MQHVRPKYGIATGCMQMLRNKIEKQNERVGTVRQKVNAARQVGPLLFLPIISQYVGFSTIPHYSRKEAESGAAHLVHAGVTPAAGHIDDHFACATSSFSAMTNRRGITVSKRAATKLRTSLS